MNLLLLPSRFPKIRSFNKIKILIQHNFNELNYESNKNVSKGMTCHNDSFIAISVGQSERN